MKIDLLNIKKLDVVAMMAIVTMYNKLKKDGEVMMLNDELVARAYDFAEEYIKQEQ